MPSEAISVFFSYKDNGSAAVIKTIGDKTKNLDKETQHLQQTTAAYEKL